MDFWMTLLNGLSQGGVYALIALGYTMVYGIAKMLNFAHGDLIMVGAYSIVVCVGAYVHPVLAIIIACIITVLLGLVMERLAYRPLRKASPLAVLITAIGVSYLLQNIFLLIFGSTPKMTVLFKLDGLAITIITLVATAIIMVLLTLFIKLTSVGKAMLAVSQDRNASNLMGINHNTTIAITFGIGSALAAIAGAFYLMKIGSVDPMMGSMPGIKAFTAAVIGGIGSIPGAMLGGFLLGVIEEFCNSIPGLSSFTIAIEFGLLILILLVKPTGFLGKKLKEKV